MEAFSGRINEVRRHDPRTNLLIAQRERADDFVADVFQSPLIQAQCDQSPVHRRPGNRGDVPASVTFDRLVRRKQDGATAL